MMYINSLKQNSPNITLSTFPSFFHLCHCHVHDHTFLTFALLSRFVFLCLTCMCVWYTAFTEELMKLWKVCVGRLSVGDGALRLCLGHWWPGWCSKDRNTSAWPALMTPAGTVTQPCTRWWLNLEAQIYVDSVHLSMGLNYKYCLKAAITAKSQGAAGNSAVGVGKEEVYWMLRESCTG